MKKFCVNVDYNEALGTLLQEEAFKAGYKWASGDTKVLFPSDLWYLFFDDKKRLSRASEPYDYQVWSVQKVLKYLESVKKEEVFKAGDWAMMDGQDIIHIVGVGNDRYECDVWDRKEGIYELRSSEYLIFLFSIHEFRKLTKEEIKEYFESKGWAYYIGAKEWNNGMDTDYWQPGKVAKIRHINLKDEGSADGDDLVYVEPTGSNSMSAFRPATEEEIKNAEKHPPILIGQYEVIFTKFGLKIGCNSVSYEQVKALYKLMIELDITNFYIEHQNVNFTTVKEIYNRIEK